MNQQPRPIVAFLGVCERSLYLTLDGHPEFAKIDLYGLCNLIPCAFFPTTLQGFEFFFAVSGVHFLNRFRVSDSPPAVAADGAGMAAFRAMTSLQLAPLNWVVSPLVRSYSHVGSLARAIRGVLVTSKSWEYAQTFL